MQKGCQWQAFCMPPYAEKLPVTAVLYSNGFRYLVFIDDVILYD